MKGSQESGAGGTGGSQDIMASCSNQMPFKEQNSFLDGKISIDLELTHKKLKNRFMMMTMD